MPDERHLTDDVEVETGARRLAALPRTESFRDVRPDGSLGLVADSNGHLALVGDRSSAALTLGTRCG